MSRHLLLDRPDRQIVLGYDRMLLSFFGQIMRGDRAIGGWPTKSGLGIRRPVYGHPEAAHDLTLLADWARRTLEAEGAWSIEAAEHLQRLWAVLLREWDDGEDSPDLPLPACLQGARP